ncbi:hypothetical protein B296_00012617 [Ensete ventricosum]|uniref:Uncharacterized protein n=1 Tax=Ensete ventricosum TaxID=4639 RepID=A0A427APN0_ENSVE|nr:hypothetical protein B296_00012617 [Ensete ventricosum]
MGTQHLLSEVSKLTLLSAFWITHGWVDKHSMAQSLRKLLVQWIVSLFREEQGQNSRSSIGPTELSNTFWSFEA